MIPFFYKLCVLHMNETMNFLDFDENIVYLSFPKKKKQYICNNNYFNLNNDDIFFWF